MIEQHRGRREMPSFDRDMIVGKSFCRNAADRIQRHLDLLSGNHDQEILRTANAALSMAGDGTTPHHGSNGRN
jgi:hypothetical protein